MNLLMLWVGIAGSLGAVCRFGVENLYCKYFNTTLSWGIFGINIVGSFLLGICMSTTLGLNPEMRTIAGLGFCGGFTTFSTLIIGVYRTLFSHTLLAIFYVLATVLGSMAAVWLGLQI